MEQIVCNINMAFEYFTFFYVIFHKEYRKLQKINIIGLITCLLIWIIGIVAGFDWQAVSIGPIPVFFIWIYIVMWILFDVSVVETAVWGIGEWLILSMLETALYLMLQPLQLESNVLDNIIMLLISCIFWMFYIFVRKKRNVQVFKLPIKMWCLIDVIMFILTAMMTFFTYVFVQDFPNNRIMFMGQMLSVLGETIIVVLIFAMLYLCNSTYDFYRQKELAEMQNKQQREYFLQLLEREEETKRFRHDIINDLLEMHNYCVNQNYKQMECYLENTLGIVQKISKSNYDVGNDIVNTVINYYLKPIKEICSIEINGYMSEKLSVDDRDLCIISANLIKNATEAVSKMENGKVWINIEEGKKYLHIQVKNTFEGKIDFDKKGMPVTSKTDKKNHGIGIHNMVDIVEKNGGTYNIEAEKGIYNTEIYLKI